MKKKEETNDVTHQVQNEKQSNFDPSKEYKSTLADVQIQVFVNNDEADNKTVQTASTEGSSITDIKTKFDEYQVTLLRGEQLCVACGENDANERCGGCNFSFYVSSQFVVVANFAI